MLTLDTPPLSGYLASAARCPDNAAVAMATVDHLLDTHPGDPLPDLCLCYARVPDDAPPATERAVRELLAWLDAGRGQVVRADEVRDQVWLYHCRAVKRVAVGDEALAYCLWDNFGRGQPLETCRQVAEGIESGEIIPSPSTRDCIAHLNRDLRRRVLALYPEVRVTIEAEVMARSVMPINPPRYRRPRTLGKALRRAVEIGRNLSAEFDVEELKAHGFNVDQKLHWEVVRGTPDHTAPVLCRVRQTLAAPDLIPPEPRGWPTPGTPPLWPGALGLTAEEAQTASIPSLEDVQHPTPPDAIIDQQGQVVPLSPDSI